MKWLELKLPPAIALMLFGILTTAAMKSDIAIFRNSKQWDGWVLVPLILAFIIIGWGVLEFRRAHTTVDPHRPNKASTLVTSGIFKYTRNPMYLGMVLMMLSATFYIGSGVGFVACVALAWYLTQFQIKPEEKIIEGLFGQDYLDYTQRVRRWL